MNLKINRFLKAYSTPAMWVAGVLILAAIVLSKFEFGTVISSVVFIIGAVLTGFPILFRAVQGLKFKTVGIEVLVSIAVIGACIIGEYSEAAIVTFLFQFGTYLEQKTMKNTRSAIKALTELAPSTAWRIEGESVNEVDVDEIDEGDLLLLKTGSQIPADGTIVDGEGYVTEASITGESDAKEKTLGSNVYAGTFVESGTLKMKASKVGEDTTFSKIIALVEEAQDAKSPVERFIDKFAKYYTPAVVVLSALTLVLTRNLDTAITILVLACPGALVIGAPIANVAGIGRAAQEGILLKGGDPLHAFVKTDCFVFDKTGTLTHGKPEVITEHRYGDKDVLSLLASAEQSSDHPVAKAILQYAEKKGIGSTVGCEVKTEKGLGLVATVDGHRLVAGNLALMKKEKIPVSEKAKTDLAMLGTATPVLVAVDGELALLLAVADAIKSEAKSSMEALRKMGAKSCILLTGDREEAAKSVAEKCSMDGYKASLLPEDKLTALRELQSEGKTVTFVGDGINDSPALTAADTGIAMGSGTDVALECSDVVLIKSDLESLVRAFRISKKTVNILYQNIAIAVGTVILLLIGLFAGFVHMGIGMLIHEASILVVILNAIRILRRTK